MTTSRTILGAALIISWAMLLSARCLAAMMYASSPGTSYEVALEHIGWVMPASAWAALVVGVLLFLCPGGDKSAKDENVK